MSSSANAKRRFQFGTRTLLLAVALSSVVSYYFAFAEPGSPVEHFFACLSPGTVYSRDYSAFGWRRIRPGMSMSQVVSILGEPLTKSDVPNQWSQALHNADEIWSYTRQENRTSDYWIRRLFFKQKAVVRVQTEYHID